MAFKRTRTALVAFVLLALLAVVYFYFSLYRALPALPKQIYYKLGVCTHGNVSSELKALDSGIRYFRTDISLGKSQESWLAYEHSTFDASYLGILDYDTLPGGFSNKNWNLTEWNESVANAIQAYPWINTWEIWNEPYVGIFQTGFVNGSAYNYFLLLKSAAKIIRSREPNATVVCFGGAPIDNEQVFDWYAQVWHYGAAEYCNAISLHAYLLGPLLPYENFTKSWSSGIEAYEALTGKPIYITEFGMPSSSAMPGYSQKMQNQFLVEGLSLFNRFSYIKRVYWYDLWGLSDGSLRDDFGLLNLSDPYTGTPSISWHTFLQASNRSAYAR
ncbi:MAG: glycosyl hydrolase [Candidatus Micrarchaeia archaeon]